MSFLGGLFGKKKEEPDFKPATGLDKDKGFDDLDSGLNMPGMENQGDSFDSFGNQRPQKFSNPFEQEVPQQQSYPQSGHQASGDMSKDLQIIIAKLDALRSEVANISHRLEALERKQGQQQKKFW